LSCADVFLLLAHLSYQQKPPNVQTEVRTLGGFCIARSEYVRQPKLTA